MIPIVSIVGKSDSGKTTLIEKLVPELVRRGYRVGTVKHDVHGFDVDREGKDSWRHKQAGARSVLIASPARIALIEDVDRDLPLQEIRDRYFSDVDLVLTEGYKRGPMPKIEVSRRERSRELICTEADDLVAVVSDQDHEVNVPVFRFEEVPALADRIEQRVLEGGLRAKASPKGAGKVQLSVDGEPVSLSPFVTRFIRRTVGGMISSLKGCESPGKIELTIQAGEER